MTNVFHESKEAILLTSILDRFCLERTTLLFSCDEYRMRWYGSSMDQVARAIYEFHSAIGCLKDVLSIPYSAPKRLEHDERLI